MMFAILDRNKFIFENLVWTLVMETSSGINVSSFKDGLGFVVVLHSQGLKHQKKRFSLKIGFWGLLWKLGSIR